MGKLTYGAIQRQITIDDRLLGHLEVVILSRLRRNNSFALRWVEGTDATGSRRRTIWVHQSTDLYFEYDTADVEPFDRDLLEKLAKQADSNTGINLQSDASDAVWVDLR